MIKTVCMKGLAIWAMAVASMRGSLLSYALYKTFVYPGKRRGNLRYEDGARLAVGRSLEEGNSVLFDTNQKQRCETSRKYRKQ
jgi:hypothetical protein